MKDIFAEYEATSRTSSNLQTRRTFTQLRKFRNWSRPQARKLRCRYFFFLFSGILPSPCCFILLTVYTHFFFSSSKNYKVMSEHPKRRMNRRQGWTSATNFCHRAQYRYFQAHIYSLPSSASWCLALYVLGFWFCFQVEQELPQTEDQVPPAMDISDSLWSSSSTVKGLLFFFNRGWDQTLLMIALY